MINIFINDDKIRFEYSKKEGLIQGELKNADEKLSDIIANIKSMKTNDELEEDRRLEIENQALLAQAELFERIIKLEERKTNY